MSYVYRPPVSQQHYAGLTPGIVPVLVGGNPPLAPIAVAPYAVGQTGFAPAWGSSPGATSYHLDVSTDIAFGSYLSGYQDLDVGNVLSYAIYGLSASTTYYFRVRAMNGATPSVDSNIITQATSAVWQPYDVGGLSLHHKPETLAALSDGDPVGTWPGSAPEGIDWRQGTSANKPLYKTGIANGYAGVLFDGVDDFMDINTNPIMGTAFLVVKLATAISSYTGLLTSNFDQGVGNEAPFVTDSLGTPWYTGSTAIATYYKDAVATTTVDTAAGNVHMYEGESGSVGPLAHEWRLGVDRSNQGIGREWPGYIFEVVVYDKVLTTLERQTVEAYLTAKYITPPPTTTAGYARSRVRGSAAPNSASAIVTTTRVIVRAQEAPTTAKTGTGTARTKGRGWDTPTTAQSGTGTARATTRAWEAPTAGKAAQGQARSRDAGWAQDTMTQALAGNARASVRGWELTNTAKAASGQARAVARGWEAPVTSQPVLGQARSKAAGWEILTASQPTLGQARSIDRASSTASTAAALSAPTAGYARIRAVSYGLAAAAQGLAGTARGRSQAWSGNTAGSAIAGNTRGRARGQAQGIAGSTVSASARGQARGWSITTASQPSLGQARGHASGWEALTSAKTAQAQARSKGTASSSATTDVVLSVSTAGYTRIRAVSYGQAQAGQTLLAPARSKARGWTLDTVSRTVAGTTHGGATGRATANTGASTTARASGHATGWSTGTTAKVAIAQARSKAAASSTATTDIVLSVSTAGYTRLRALSYGQMSSVQAPLGTARSRTRGWTLETVSRAVAGTSVSKTAGRASGQSSTATRGWGQAGSRGTSVSTGSYSTRGQARSKDVARSDATTEIVLYVASGGFTRVRAKSFAGASPDQGVRMPARIRQGAWEVATVTAQPSGTARVADRARGNAVRGEGLLGYARGHAYGQSSTIKGQQTAARARGHAYARGRAAIRPDYTPALGIYAVGAQDRVYRVEEQDRVYRVGTQDRTYRPEPQDRTYRPGPQDRLMTAHENN